MAISLTIRRLLSIQPIDLPVFHPIALKLVHLLSDFNYTIDELVNTANDDQALVGQILKMANSSSYIGRVKVETIKDALIRLGAHHVSNLAMSASQAALHASRNSTVNAVMRELWFHSHGCAVGCRWVAMNTGHRDLAEQCYLAGLLHDVGKLYLIKALERITNAGVAQAALERELLLEIFDEMHVEQGNRLMEHWNMPPVYRTAVDRHSNPVFDPADLALVIVRLVNVVTRTCGLSFVAAPDQPLAELPEAVRLGMGERQLEDLVRVLEETRCVSFLPSQE